MEDSVLCYSEKENRFLPVSKKIITEKWMNRTGFKPYEHPTESSLFCDDVKKEVKVAKTKEKQK